jgi:hypothetical protein
MMMNLFRPALSAERATHYLRPKVHVHFKEVKTNKAPKLIILHHWSQSNDIYCSHFRVLVIAGRRVFLKLCFQVLIVLSSADEAGACGVHEGAWGGCGIDDL